MTYLRDIIMEAENYTRDEAQVDYDLEMAFDNYDDDCYDEENEDWYGDYKIW